MRGLVFSSYVNAYTIYKGAKHLGVEVFTTDQSPNFPLKALREEKNCDFFFFTEEASLLRALNSEKASRFLPRSFPNDLLDNKWAFSNWLTSKPGLTTSLKQWTIDCTTDVEYPCLLKAKHSWHGAQKLPRGWVCNNLNELSAAIKSLKYNGFESSHFFIQQWLGLAGCRVISVCGFHDANDNSRNLTAIVERIAAHTQGLSCSSAVETIFDEWNLVNRTQEILDALKFVGPYELEFLVVDSKVYALELNPRFWMQHAIFIYKGNGLIKRYLGLDNSEEKNKNMITDVVWIDGLHLLHSILTLKLDFIYLVVRKYFSQKKFVLIWPSLPIAIYVRLRMARNKIYAKIFR